MIKYVNYDIVFQEFPDEVTLAINCSLCPNSCPGCHSPQLAEDIGEQLTKERLFALIAQFDGQITCVALMGGDNDPAEVQRLLEAVQDEYSGYIHTGWYSGRQELPKGFNTYGFNYVKLGPYKKECGPLKDRNTNQRFYQIVDGFLEDRTVLFWR